MEKKIAFLFPGQGSQFAGMGKALAEAWPECREVYERADAVLSRPLSRICFEGPDDDLKQTVNTQPALYATSIAALAALTRFGVRAQAAAGHSLGEYSALAAAGAMDWESGLLLVQARADAMHKAATNNPGAMAAVMAGADLVRQACDAVGDGVVLANINAPEQIVVSGTKEGVEALIAKVKEMGVRRAIPLPVSGAFHSPLMRAAVEEFAPALESAIFHDPQIPVVANVTAEPATERHVIPDLLAQQLTGPVRWVECMERLGAMGVELFIEVGAGKVLAGLAKRINPSWTVLPCGTPEEIEAVREALRA